MEGAVYNPGRTWIGIRIDEGELLPLIRVDGEKGINKKVRNIAGVKRIDVCWIEFEKCYDARIGVLNWPENVPSGDLMITYDMAGEMGEVTILGTEYVWIYYKNENEAPYNSIDELEKQRLANGVVDRERLKEIEEKRAEPKVVWPEELAAELEREIFGQEEGIRKISELVSSNLRRKKPELETILLFGRTGVGKTEVGKALAPALTKLTGIEYGFQQVALNEFTGEHTICRFTGSPAGYVGYGDKTIFEPIRKNPYHVYLLDEIEKSTAKIWTALMEMFSSGKIRPADNSPAIDLCHTIIIITSNIPIDMQEYNRLSSFKQKELCRNRLAKECGHPEVAGKIRNCIAFQELKNNDLTDVILKFIFEELDNYNVVLKRVDEVLIAEFKEMLRDNNYGARGVKDAVREALVSGTVYDRDFKRFEGKGVKLSGTVDNIKMEVA